MVKKPVIDFSAAINWELLDDPEVLAALGAIFCPAEKSEEK